MSVGLRLRHEIAPVAEPSFPLKVDDTSGRKSLLFSPGGRPEVWVTAPVGDSSFVLAPTSFATLKLADEAVAVLERAFERVNELAAAPKPDECAHTHGFVNLRFSRSIPYVPICRVCGKEGP